MEETASQSYNEILLGTFEEDYGFNPDLGAFRRRTTINYFDPNNPGVPPGSDSGIKKIEVRVFWRFPLGVTEKEVKLATLIAER